MKRSREIIPFIIAMLCSALFCGCSGAERSGQVVSVFAGSASRPALAEIARLYTQKTGVRVELTFGGSGMVLSQMRMAARGDVYAPGSSDFMEKAIELNVVDRGAVRIAAYLVPAINIKSGNPGSIKTLEDLARPGVRVGIARPEQVCVGLYAVEIMEKSGLLDKIAPNIAVMTESCAKTASAIATTNLDAVIGWRVFQYWSAAIESIPIDPARLPRLGYMPLAVSNYSRRRSAAADLVSYATGPEGKAIFKKHGYITDEAEARLFAPNAKMGGLYVLPPRWKGFEGL